MDAEKTLQLLFHANRLKAIPCVGWQMRGVFHAPVPQQRWKLPIAAKNDTIVRKEIVPFTR